MGQYKGVTFNKQKNKYISSVCENSVTELEAVKSLTTNI